MYSTDSRSVKAMFLAAGVACVAQHAAGADIDMNVGCGRYQAFGTIAGENLEGRGGHLDDLRHLAIVVDDIHKGRITTFRLPELTRGDVTLDRNNLRFVQIWKPDARLWLRWDHAGPPSFEIYKAGWGQKSCAPIDLNETRIR